MARKWLESYLIITKHLGEEEEPRESRKEEKESQYSLFYSFKREKPSSIEECLQLSTSSLQAIFQRASSNPQELQYFLFALFREFVLVLIFYFCKISLQISLGRKKLGLGPSKPGIEHCRFWLVSPQNQLG